MLAYYFIYACRLIVDMNKLCWEEKEKSSIMIRQSLTLSHYMLYLMLELLPPVLPKENEISYEVNSKSQITKLIILILWLLTSVICWRITPSVLKHHKADVVYGLNVGWNTYWTFKHLSLVHYIKHLVYDLEFFFQNSLFNWPNFSD